MNENTEKSKLVKYIKMACFIGLFMLIYLVAQCFVSFAAAIIFIIKSIVNMNNYDINQLLNWVIQNTCYIVFFSALIALPFYILVSVCRKERFTEAAGFRKLNIKNTLLSALLGVETCIIVTFILSFIPIERWFPDYIKSMEFLNSSSLFSIIISVVIMGPIIEEIIFRGFILRELRRNFSILTAVIIQGVLFGIYHFNMLQSIYTAIVGIAFGVIFVWTESLWSSIFAHMFMNLTSILLDRFLGEEVSIELIILALVAIIASVFTVKLLWSGKNDNDITAVSGNS